MVALISLICVVIETLRHLLTLSVSGRDEEEDWSDFRQINTALWSFLWERWKRRLLIKWQTASFLKINFIYILYMFNCKKNQIFAFLGTEPRACKPGRDVPPNHVCLCQRDELLEFFRENDNLSENRTVCFRDILSSQLHFGGLSNRENLKWLSIYTGPPDLTYQIIKKARNSTLFMLIIA